MGLLILVSANRIMQEIIFQKSWFALYFLIPFYCLGLVIMFFFVVKMIEENNYKGIFVDLVTMHAIYLILFWELMKVNTIKYYENGISFLKFFKRHFVNWSEIENITATGYAHTLIFGGGKGIKKTRKITIGWMNYSNQNETREFVLNKVREYLFYDKKTDSFIKLTTT